MKRTCIGIALLVSATLMDAGILIASALLGMNLTEWEGRGRLWTALTDNSMSIPFAFANIILIISLIILAREYIGEK